jgi:hypothetical protein
MAAPALEGPRSVDPKGLEEPAITAGVAIGVLDAVVLQQQKGRAGAWGHRLALTAAAATARQARRVEDEATLRDTVLLTPPGDDVGPAGGMLLAWRRLTARPTDGLLTEASVAVLFANFDLAPDKEAVGDLMNELRRIGGEAMVSTLAAALEYTDHHGLDRGIGAWIANVVLAQRLGWPFALPLRGTEASAGGSTRRTRGRRGNPARPGRGR